MRVGLDYRTALFDRGGAGRTTRELVRAMVELKFGGSLGLFGYTGQGRRYSLAELGLEGAGAELLRLRLPRFLLPWLLARLDKGVDDLVGGCEVYHHTQPDALRIRAATEIVSVRDCIDSIEADESAAAGFRDPEAAGRANAAARELVQRASRILVPSEYVGAEVVMSFGVNPGRIAVTPPGCDHLVRHLPPAGFPKPAEPFVLTVGTVGARKNHLRLLEAFELLAKDGHPHGWVVAGRPGYGARSFERALARSPVKNRVRWLRAVDDAELTRLYAQADALVWASLSEGFGLPPLEAMVCGTPVVASCVTSMPEVCGDAAFLVEPTESERIFEATRRLLAEPDLAEEFVLRGKRRAREFMWRDCARSTLIAYQAARSGEGDEPRMQGLF